MSLQSFSQLITENLQYDGFKITKQCPGINAAACTNKRRFQYYPTRKKITPLQQRNSAAKKNNQLSDVAIGA